MKKTGIVLLVLAILGAAAYAGPQKEAVKSAKQPGQYTQEDLKGLEIAFMPKTLNNDFYVAMGNAAEDEAKKYGMTVFKVAPSDTTHFEEQVNMVENVIQRGSIAIVISPTHQAMLTEPAKKAQDRGVWVFNVDTRFDDNFPVSKCGTDNYAGGYEAGVWLGKQLGGKGIVAVEEGYSGNINTEARFNGFKKAIADLYPGVTIAMSAYGNNEQAQGMAVAENFITALPGLNAIFCANDTMALGAAEALAAAGKSQSIILVGFDGNPVVAQKILDGQITATIAQRPATMGRTAVQQLVKYLTTGKIDEYDINTGAVVVTKENARTFLSWQ
jgi:ABC-type sugar transport system substrate-binding protein